ncbi:MAG: hypothetical protein ACK4M7_03870 [Burkholderiales bacterium]
MKKLLLVMGILTTATYADCTFQVTNYSQVAINIEAGFFTQPKKKIYFTIPAAQTKHATIKSAIKCDELTLTGLGVSYISLVSQKSSGGWVYSPSSAMIRAVGYSTMGSRGVIGLAPNGAQLFLYNNYKPKPATFAVVVENAQRNVSRQLGSIN